MTMVFSIKKEDCTFNLEFLIKTIAVISICFCGRTSLKAFYDSEDPNQEEFMFMLYQPVLREYFGSRDKAENAWKLHYYLNLQWIQVLGGLVGFITNILLFIAAACKVPKLVTPWLIHSFMLIIIALMEIIAAIVVYLNVPGFEPIVTTRIAFIVVRLILVYGVCRYRRAFQATLLKKISDGKFDA